MTRSRLNLRTGAYLTDGATGTQLQKDGLPAGEFAYRFFPDREDRVVRLHLSYLEAGCQILRTNTFGLWCNPETPDTETLARAKQALRCARQAVHQYETSHPQTENSHWIAYSIGPFAYRMNNPDEAAIRQAIRPLIQLAQKERADCLWLETQCDYDECRALLLEARTFFAGPVLVSFSCRDDGRLFAKGTLEAAVVMASGLGADAVGLNCSPDATHAAPLLGRIRTLTDLPLLACPGAGLADMSRTPPVFPIGPETFYAGMEACVREGATLVGGCCGTDPEYIREIRPLLALCEPCGNSHSKEIPYVCAREHVLSFSDESAVLGTLSGEEEGPLLQSWKNGDTQPLRQCVTDMMADGARGIVLSLEDGERISRIARWLQDEFDLPLFLSASDLDSLKKTLHACPGRCGVLWQDPDTDPDDLTAALARYGAYLLSFPEPEKSGSPTSNS